MITAITAEGYGPHQSKRLAFPLPYATVRGSSESGKTCGTLGALALALWGVDRTGKPADTSLINNQDDSATITVEFDGGRSLKATLNRARKQTWAITDPNAKMVRPKATTKAEHAAQLGVVGKNEQVGLAILAPLYWVQFAQAECARPLRDLLMSVLPPQDLKGAVMEWMGPTWDDSLPLHLEPKGERGAKLPGALDLQKQANADASQAAGALRTSRDVRNAALETLKQAELATVEIEPLDTVKLEAAKKYMGMVEPFRAWQAEQSAWEAHQAQVKAQDLRVLGWDNRKAALPPEPAPMPSPYSPEEHRAAKASLAKARAASQDAIFAARKEHPDMPKAQAEASRWRSVVNFPNACPHCGKPTVAGVESVEQATEELARTEKHIATLTAENQAATKAALQRANVALEDAEKAVAAHDTLLALHNAHAAYAASVAALGERPGPYAPANAPAEPSPWKGPPMTPELITRAEARIRDAADHEAKIERAKAQRLAKIEAADAALSAATERLNKAEEASQAAERRASVASGLVQALRRAPSELAQRAQKDLEAPLARGGITLKWAPEDAPKSAPVVEVFVDDLPWHCLSTGRQLVADAWLRATLRDFAQKNIPCEPGALLTWADIPIIVDNAQSWSGDWFDQPFNFRQPIWFLMTEEDELSVVTV